MKKLFIKIALYSIGVLLTAIIMETTVLASTISRNGVDLDTSTASRGTLRLRYTDTGRPNLSLKLTDPSGTSYSFMNIRNDGSFDVFPLTGGSGRYRVQIGRQTADGRWAQVFNEEVNVTIADPLAPFLQSNTRVNFDAAPRTVAKARELTAGRTQVVDQVAAVFYFLVENFEYDFALAEAIMAGAIHHPVLDESLARGRGVCYDFAAIMVGMLRSQDIPSRLVFGFKGTVYHAWVDVYSEESGWINSILQLEGGEWRLLDPTIAATGGEEGMRLTNDRRNFSARFFF